MSAASILVIDDDLDIRNAIADVLTDEGYHTVTAADGARGLEFLRAQSSYPSLIILDLRMPGMDGQQVGEALRGDPKLKAIPIVLVSADANVKKVALELGAIGYLRKPMEMDLLLEIVATACAATPGESSVTRT